MHLEEGRRTLMRSDLFRGLKDVYLDIILVACEEVRYRAGETIFREGDAGDALYLVASGVIEILLEPQGDDDPPVPVAVLKTNGTLGEVTLVGSSGRRTATARCRSDAQLIRLPKDHLLRLCHDYPQIGYEVMYRIAAELAAKLRASNVSIRERFLFTSGQQDAEVDSANAIPSQSPRVA